MKKDDETSDVLVGRIGSLSDETYENAIADLKEDNPVIGDKVSGGDVILKSPCAVPFRISLQTDTYCSATARA